MSTQNTSPPDQNRYRTFEDLEVYLTEDQLDELLADPGGPPLQHFNASTV